MAVSAQQMVRHFEDNERHALEVIGWYEALQRDVEARIERVRAQEQRSRTALAQAYLPALDAAALQRAEALTGYRGFSRRDPLKAMARERVVLERTVARIEGDPSYQRRQYLVGPHGELTRQLEEVQQMLEPWEQDCQRFEELDGFLELVRIHYDTPAFGESWLKASYWRHWKQGDAICSALEMDDFGDDVLPAYRKVEAERTRWRAQRGEVQAKVDAVHGLVRERDQAALRLPRLEELYLQGAIEMLSGFLSQADLPLLEQWSTQDAGGDRAIAMSLRTVAGLQAKVRYLEEMRTQGIEPFIRDLRIRKAKYSRKVSKFSRSKYIGTSLPERWQDRKFTTKLDKYRQRQEKLQRLMDRLEAYDDYQRFQLSNDPDAWWLEMTGKRPSRLTPRLRAYYERHPDLAVERDRDEAAAAALASAPTTDEDWSYLS